MQNDIYDAMGKGNVMALTLLDLSAAFDTIDHKIPLNRLANMFGISEDVMNWVVSYLGIKQIPIHQHFRVPFQFQLFSFFVFFKVLYLVLFY